MKIALFHPWIKSRGGAEKVVLDILKSKSGTIDLYTWNYDKNNTFDEFKNYNIIELGPKFFKRFSRNFILRGLFLISAFFSKIPLEKYDLFLISTSGMGEFVLFRNYLPGKTYAYVHTPLRAASRDIYIWTMKNQMQNIFPKIIYFFAIKIYNLFERFAWKKIDFAIFNSSLTKNRAKIKGLINDKKTDILWPSIDVLYLTKFKSSDKKYILYVSRLNPNKRQDVVIKIWSTLKNTKGYKLIIAGGIEDEHYYTKLLNLAKDNNSIKIIPNISQNEKYDLFANCSCGIFLGYKEDFGILPFEYLAFKKPAIITDGCGYMDILKDSKDVYIVKESNLETDLSNVLKLYIKNPKIVKNIDYIKDLDSKNFIRKLELILK